MNGCSASATFSISVFPCVVIEKYNLSLNGIKIFPNPFKNTLVIESDTQDQEYFNIQLLNALGQVVYTETNDLSKSEIKVKDLSAGLYFVKIKNEKGEKTFKVIKE